MIKRLVTEPLVVFTAIGVFLFVLYGLARENPGPEPDGAEIVITELDVARLQSGFEAVWRRPPNPQEMTGLIENQIREEVLVREAESLGLDRDDAIIRQRLRQKMEFLLSAAANALDPSEDQLQAHLQDNADTFRTPARVAFRQVFLGPSPGSVDVETTIAALADGADPSVIGERTLLPFDQPLATDRALDGTFGSGFGAQLADLPVGTWAGPVTSGYGQHVVLIAAREPAQLPALADIRAMVEADWRRAQAESLSTQQYEALASRYSVKRLDLSE